MKAILFLALVASATAIPFLDRLNQRLETTTIEFSPWKVEDMSAVEHAPKDDEVIEDVETTTVDFSPAILAKLIARRRQQAQEKIETTTIDFSPWIVEDMGAPEHMSWPVHVDDEVIEDVETTTVDFSPAKIVELIARRRQQAVEKVETTTIEFSPWEDMGQPEHAPIPMNARREALRLRLEEMVHRRA